MMQHHPARADRNPFVTGFLLLFAADILFLPIILPIPVPISALVIAPWYLISIGKVPKALLSLCILGIVLVLASYLLGQNNYVSGAETYLERFVNTGILMFMFGSYALVQTDVAEREKVLEYTLLGFIVFSFVMSLIFFASPNLYFAIRSFWTFSGDEIFYTDLTTLVRFTGILSDPNNMACATIAIAALLVFRKPTALIRNLFIIIAISIIAVACMSITGFLVLALFIGSYVAFGRFFQDAIRNTTMRVAIMVLIGLVFAGVYTLIRDTAVFALAMERFESGDVDSRLSRWLIVFDTGKILSSAWFGDGGSIIWLGRDYRPHNGHLFIIFSFGVFAYALFMYIFFYRPLRAEWRTAIFLLVMFVIFTVNVGIYEHRFAGIWVMLTALHCRYAFLDALPQFNRAMAGRSGQRGPAQRNAPYRPPFGVPAPGRGQVARIPR